MSDRLPYVMFTAQNVLVGLLGPYDDMAAATRAADAMIAAEQAAMVGLDVEHPDVRIPAFWEQVKVLDLTHDELDALEAKGARL